jgi:hypothetical protein
MGVVRMRAPIGIFGAMLPLTTICARIGVIRGAATTATMRVAAAAEGRWERSRSIATA